MSTIKSALYIKCKVSMYSDSNKFDFFDNKLYMHVIYFELIYYFILAFDRRYEEKFLFFSIELLATEGE